MGWLSDRRDRLAVALVLCCTGALIAPESACSKVAETSDPALVCSPDAGPQAFCGDSPSLSCGDPNALYRCSDAGVAALIATCPNGCLADFDGGAACAPPGPRCIRNPGVGNHCGGEPVVADGDPNVIYHCDHVGAATPIIRCPRGCVYNAAGLPYDSCVPPPAPTCVDEPDTGPPALACGTGGDNLGNNGACGSDDRVYYCRDSVWRLKEDCRAEGRDCVLVDGGTEFCGPGDAGFQTPDASCEVGNDNGPDNGTCGPDGRLYYCCQQVWHLKEDCKAERRTCIMGAKKYPDYCSGAPETRACAPPAGQSP